MSLIRRLSVLIALVLGLGVMAAVTTTAQAAPDDSPFSRLRGLDLAGPDVRVRPKDYSASRVDLAALKAQLPGVNGSTVISVPAPSGRLERFRIERTSVMESELAAAHPEISTYAGLGLDDTRSTIALDITPMGFHASVRSPQGQRAWYVDPAFNGRGTIEHVSYYGAALPEPEQRRAEEEVQALRETIDAKRAADRITPGGPVTRRNYRLALTSDQSYAAYFGTANVLAEKVTLINRVNQIYNDDLAVNLRLVNATDALNLDTDAKAIGANGPCGASPCFTESNLESCFIDTLGKNRTVLGQLVGASNYDVGHIALGKNGGGIAYLGVVGGDYKGGGCTGLPIPTGDFFAVDYVAHEIGHQFNGDHTFNGAQGNCGGNIGEPAVEPGSGSSVMAYAGICGRDDLQAHTDPYFSFKTVDQVHQMFEFDYSNIEVQTVSLRNFGAGDSFTLAYGGAVSDPITFGGNYTATVIKAVVEDLTGETVTITQWGFDEVWDSDADGNPIVTAPDATGFQVIFNDGPTVFDADETDVDLPQLTLAGTGVTGFVGETAQGGIVLPNGVAETAANTAPVVTAPADKTIPLRTPFALTGSGTDADGNSLIYLWEQTDFGDGVELAENNRVTGPLFRVFGQAADVTDEDSFVSPSPGQNIADGSPTRIFPDMAQILAGNTNAAQPCPTPTEDVDTMMSRPLRECYSELLPMTGYTGSLDNVDEDGNQLPPAMNFRLTARDRFVNGGGLAFDDVKLTLDPTTGPFLVTSQAAAGGAVTGGAPTPVTWAVNGTQKLAANVKISLSTDGGKTFGTVLSASTPNDGNESLTMPNVVSADSRIKIEGRQLLLRRQRRVVQDRRRPERAGHHDHQGAQGQPFRPGQEGVLQLHLDRGRLHVRLHPRRQAADL